MAFGKKLFQDCFKHFVQKVVFASDLSKASGCGGHGDRGSGHHQCRDGPGVKWRTDRRWLDLHRCLVRFWFGQMLKKDINYITLQVTQSFHFMLWSYVYGQVMIRLSAVFFEECLWPPGVQYRTKSGYACETWGSGVAASYNSTTYSNLASANNYCRNPYLAAWRQMQ